MRNSVGSNLAQVRTKTERGSKSKVCSIESVIKTLSMFDFDLAEIYKDLAATIKVIYQLALYYITKYELKIAAQSSNLESPVQFPKTMNFERH